MSKINRVVLEKFTKKKLNKVCGCEVIIVSPMKLNSESLKHTNLDKLTATFTFLSCVFRTIARKSIPQPHRKIHVVVSFTLGNIFNLLFFIYCLVVAIHSIHVRDMVGVLPEMTNY